MIKRIIVHLRKWVKFLILIIISLFIILGVITLVYKPTYQVTLNGEQIGYTNNKNDLQDRINNYIEGNGQNNVAFIEIGSLPQYKFCFLNKNIETNDDEIYNKVISQGQAYYNYFAVTLDGEEKYYVSSYQDAKDVVEQLKEKESNNVDKIGISEKYELETKEFTEVAKVVEDLYVEKPKVVVTKKATSSSTKYKTSGSFSASGASGSRINLGIDFINPVSGIITSRFGYRSSSSTGGVGSTNHKGLDIGASTGTPIYACADGVVTMSGWYSGYGNTVIVDHGDGVQTLYAHCSSLIADYGDEVSQGELIARVGSTGNSTGPHLHLGVIYNGTYLNPAYYVDY